MTRAALLACKLWRVLFMYIKKVRSKLIYKNWLYSTDLPCNEQLYPTDDRNKKKQKTEQLSRTFRAHIEQKRIFQIENDKSDNFSV
jgi:hypothetical protein